MFEVIAGSGHCGTMWLSKVLDSVPGLNWHHEYRTTATGWPWWVADLHPPHAAGFAPYWDYAREMAASHFGDSNSWPPESLPAVNDILHIDRVIYLTRDKEAQLHSIMTTSPIWSKAPYSAAAHARLDLYADISGLPRGVELLVKANDFMPDWLRGFGLNVEVYSLEDLTTNVETLRRLAPLADDELIAWQGQKINQKVYA